MQRSFDEWLEDGDYNGWSINHEKENITFRLDQEFFQ
jgi:hypothetical protein